MPQYWCKDCMVGPLWCKSCLVERHDQSPLHSVSFSLFPHYAFLIHDHAFQMWNRLFFQKSTLRDLSLRIQLGHAYGHSCPTKLAANSIFCVIHSTGIHHVAIDQCHCHGVNLNKQLLCVSWWPATLIDPKSAATFQVLHHFHLLNLQGKVTGYSFYQALEYQTDNTGLDPPPVCPFHAYPPLPWHADNKVRIVWRHSCWWSVNGATSRCWSGQDKLSIQGVFAQQLPVLWQYHAVHAPCQISIFPGDGRMCRQRECMSCLYYTQ
jgi:hypothetical protein